MQIHKSHQFLFLWFILQLVFSVILYYQTEFQVHGSYIESKKEEISSIVIMVRNNAENMIKNMPDNSKADRLQAEQAVVNYLRGFQVDDMYFWANDQNAISRVHPKEKILGQFQNSYIRHVNLLELNPIAFEIKTNPNITTGIRQEKINVITYLKPWRWVIGYGSYVDVSEIATRTISLMIIPLSGLLLSNLVLLLYVRRFERKLS